MVRIGVMARVRVRKSTVNDEDINTKISREGLATVRVSVRVKQHCPIQQPIAQLPTSPTLVQDMLAFAHSDQGG